MRRLGSLDARQFVLRDVHAILIDELVCAKVERKVLWAHALDGFIGEYAASHGLLVYL